MDKRDSAIEQIPICQTLSGKLTWSHYKDARSFKEA